MRADLPSTHKPVEQATTGVKASILEALQVGAAQQPMLALALLALAATAITAITAIIAAGIVVGQCLVSTGIVVGQCLVSLAKSVTKIARAVPARAICDSSCRLAAVAGSWAMTHKKTIIIVFLALQTPGIIFEVLKIFKK